MQVPREGAAGAHQVAGGVSGQAARASGADIDDVLWAREMIAHGMVVALKQAIEMGLGVGYLAAGNANARRNASANC